MTGEEKTRYEDELLPQPGDGGRTREEYSQESMDIGGGEEVEYLVWF